MCLPEMFVTLIYYLFLLRSSQQPVKTEVCLRSVAVDSSLF